MSGTIAISPENRWSAAGWLFDWTLEFLADTSANAEVAANLREIVAENLGWLGLDDYGPKIAADLREVIRHQLVAGADQRLPHTVPDRPAVIELLRELAEKAS